jgi:phosphate transport system permease protein
MQTSIDQSPVADQPLRLGSPGRARGESLFRFLASGAGMAVLAVLFAIVCFLAVQAMPALRQAGTRFFTELQWFPDADPPRFGVAALAFGTVVSSALALLMAVPVAIGSALFVTELASPRLGRWLGHLIDLLAAVPSVVYGLWGVAFLVRWLVPFQRWLDTVTGGLIPLFHSRSGTYGRSLFAASVVLAIMVLPIVAAISREIFRQAPPAQKEAALALGATRWETIRLAVLPFSRGGLVGASMLGLGRAMGETIAVALVLSASFTINLHLVEPGGNTIAANIATKVNEAGVLGRQALIASGLVLFAITLVVNVAARMVVARSARAAAQGRP